jgi:hypothetical protein
MCCIANLCVICSTDLLGTIQLMKKSKEGTPAASVKPCSSHDKDACTGIDGVNVEDSGNSVSNRLSSGSVPSTEKPRSPNRPKHIKKINATDLPGISVQKKPANCASAD